MLLSLPAAYGLRALLWDGVRIAGDAELAPASRSAGTVPRDRPEAPANSAAESRPDEAGTGSPRGRTVFGLAYAATMAGAFLVLASLFARPR